jgi:kumamolisin
MAVLTLAAACTGSHTVAPPISHLSPRSQGAIMKGRTPADEPIDFVIGLPLRDTNTLAVLHADVAAGRTTPLSPDEFGARFGAADSTYQAVVDWAAGQGFEIVRTSAGHTSLSLRGTAGQVGHAFATELGEFSDPTGDFRAPLAELALPESLAEVTGVVGLDTAGAWVSHIAQQPVPANVTGATGSFAPADIQALYRLGEVQQHGEGETVAILGTGRPPNPTADVAAFMTHYDLGALAPNQYTQHFVGGPNRDSSALADNEYGENVLDVDMVLAVAPKAKVVHVMTATNGPGLFTDGLSYVVNRLPNAHTVSVSYGVCERIAAPQFVVMDALFAQAKAEGQQWFFASGDTGTDGCRDGVAEKILTVGWPASSPYVIGVGGTQIETPITDATTEVAWPHGGGGQSEAFKKPAYQVGVGPFASDNVRDEPDVAALAGAPGVEIFAGGHVFGGVQGTSAAAPMWAGVWALLDQSRGGRGITTAAEGLYALGKSGQAGFNDITSGKNAATDTALGFEAGNGYDLATGWGTPDVPNLIKNWGTER